MIILIQTSLTCWSREPIKLWVSQRNWQGYCSLMLKTSTSNSKSVIFQLPNSADFGPLTASKPHAVPFHPSEMCLSAFRKVPESSSISGLGSLSTSILSTQLLLQLQHTPDFNYLLNQNLLSSLAGLSGLSATLGPQLQATTPTSANQQPFLMAAPSAVQPLVWTFFIFFFALFTRNLKVFEWKLAILNDTPRSHLRVLFSVSGKFEILSQNCNFCSIFGVFLLKIDRNCEISIFKRHSVIP